MIAVLLFSSGYVTGVSYAVLSTSSPATNLPSLKITSPHKGQQVPVDGPGEMEVMLFVVIAGMAVEVVKEVMHLVVLDEAMKSCRFQYTKLSFHLH